MPFYFKFRHFDRHENSTDVILCLHKMKRTDWLLCLAKNCDWFKFKIQKIQKNLNRALSSSVRLSSNRSWARTNQNARITWVIAGPREARNPNLDSDQRIADYACAPRL